MTTALSLPRSSPACRARLPQAAAASVRARAVGPPPLTGGSRNRGPRRAVGPANPWRIDAAELARRRDLRGLRICSIDPPTARDLDDALHCLALEDGNYEVGVHIADVAHFIDPGCALDDSAAARATSVYLVQKVIPMLPRLLCEQLCSLNPGAPRRSTATRGGSVGAVAALNPFGACVRAGEERLAFSVIWTLDPSGNIIDSWFGRTIINSCFKLHYGQAQVRPPAPLAPPCPSAQPRVAEGIAVRTAAGDYRTQARQRLPGRVAGGWHPRRPRGGPTRDFGPAPATARPLNR
eukprot:SAG11_NODE_1253_length_5385_cov_1.942679_5_plen_294_part_00